MTASAQTDQDVRLSQQEIEVARVYAEAALGLAEAQGLADRILEEIQGLAGLLNESPELEMALSSPLVETDERRVLIDKLFRGQLEETLVDTLQVMNRKGRSGLVRALAEAYRQEYNELKGMVETRVQTAVPLTTEMKKRLKDVVSSLTGKTAILEESTDESLIGGMVLHVGDGRMDTSLAKELRTMERSLTDRAAGETRGGGGWASED